MSWLCVQEDIRQRQLLVWMTAQEILITPGEKQFLSFDEQVFLKEEENTLRLKTQVFRHFFVF